MSNSVTFSDFTERFEEVTLPVVLNETLQEHLAREGKLLPEELQSTFLTEVPFFDADDEFTEYTPAFRFYGPEKSYQGFVIWKASLLNYEFILVTFSDKGEVISSNSISGTKAHGDTLIRSVATITDQFNIVVVAGLGGADETLYDPTRSESVEMELLPSGKIVMMN